MSSEVEEKHSHWFIFTKFKTIHPKNRKSNAHFLLECNLNNNFKKQVSNTWKLYKLYNTAIPPLDVDSRETLKHMCRRHVEEDSLSHHVRSEKPPKPPSKKNGTQTEALWQSRRVGWGGRWEEVQKGVDMCVPMADSCWCLTENNKIL